MSDDTLQRWLTLKKPRSGNGCNRSGPGHAQIGTQRTTWQMQAMLSGSSAAADFADADFTLMSVSSGEGGFQGRPLFRHC